VSSDGVGGWLHYGTATSLTEYHTTANTYYFSLNSMPFEDVEINLTASLSNAKASFDPVTHWSGDVDAIHHLDFDGYSQMNTYSDLDFEVLEFKAEVYYYVTRDLSILAEIDYNKFNDYQPYVYGDQTGKWVYGKLGFRYFF